MEFRILCSLEVYNRGRPLPLGGRQQRALLALLLIHANDVVSLDEIIEDLWGTQPPASATKSVQALVSKLRKLFADERDGRSDNGGEDGILLTRSHGYQLKVMGGQLDLDQFRSLTEEGRRALAAGRAADGADKLREALKLWRGPPLAELTYESFARVEIARLEELRLSALEERIEADLALGHHQELIPELEALVARNPLRERLRGQLMLALYRSGRQAEALQAYQRARHTLVDELGIEPGQALQRAEKAILRQDESLELQSEKTPEKPSSGEPIHHRSERPTHTLWALSRLRRRHRFVVAALVLAAAVGVPVFTLTSSGPKHLAGITPSSVGVIDPTSNNIIADIAVGPQPDSITVGNGTIYVANLGDNTVSKIDAHSRAVTTVSVDSFPDALTFGAGTAWLIQGSLVSTVTRIGASGASGLRSFAIRGIVERTGRGYWGMGPDPPCINRTFGEAGAAGVAAAAFGAGRVWFICGANPPVLGRLDPETNRVGRKNYRDAVLSTAIAVTPRSVWIANAQENTISEVDPLTEQTLEQVNVAADPAAIAVSPGGTTLWIASFLADEVSRVDVPGHGLPPTVTTIRVGDGPVAIVFGEGSVWVANANDHTISRIDPKTDDVTATIKLGNVSVRGIAVGAGKVWVTAQSPSIKPIGPGATPGKWGAR
jgi:YVTN family beta-propeller protein